VAQLKPLLRDLVKESMTEILKGVIISTQICETVSDIYTELWHVPHHASTSQDDETLDVTAPIFDDLPQMSPPLKLITLLWFLVCIFSDVQDGVYIIIHSNNLTHDLSSSRVSYGSWVSFYYDVHYMVFILFTVMVSQISPPPESHANSGGS
jgi:hypothetical protein